MSAGIRGSSPGLDSGDVAPFRSEYDPLEDLVVAQAHRPESLAKVNLRTLSPFLRAVLTIDGTVTKYIEAYAMEPVQMVRVRQERRDLQAEHVWLETTAGTAVVARETLMWGTYSRRLYVYATSLFVPERLPDNVNRSLDDDTSGLGRVLVASRLETYREVLWYGRERLSRLPDEAAGWAGQDFLSRTYRIFLHRKPVMLINEKFPAVCDWADARE
jgi:chorismate-pyruvate lyase